MADRLENENLDPRPEDYVVRIPENTQQSAQDFIKIQPEVAAAKISSDWPRVVALLAEVLIQPDQPWPLAALSDLAIALQNLGRLEEADSLYATLRERYPERAIGWSGRISIARLREDWPAVAQGWRECLDRFPDQEAAWWRIGLVTALRKLGDVAAATSAATELRDRWPNNPAGWQFGAELAQQAGDLEAAAAAWQACLKQFPSQQKPAWWAHLVSALHKLERLDEAAQACATLQAGWPDDPASLRVAAEVAAARSDWPAAADLWKAFFTRFPAAATPDQFFSYATLLVKAKRHDELPELIERVGKLWPRALALDPELRGEPKAHMALRVWLWQAQFSLKNGEPARAHRILEGFPADINLSAKAEELRIVAREMMDLGEEYGPKRSVSLGEQGFESWPSAQVWRCPEGSDQAIFLFPGGGDAFWIAMRTLHGFLRHLGRHLVFLMDESRTIYLPPSADESHALANQLREIAASLGATQIYCAGPSFGGYAALRFGLELGAKAVLGFGAITDPRRHKLDHFQRQFLERIRRDQPDLVIDAAELYLNAEVRPLVTLIYGAEHKVDVTDAQRMRHVPGVTLMPIAGYGDHSIMRWLIANKRLVPLFQEMLDETPMITQRAE